jgi:hypothetical protein
MKRTIRTNLDLHHSDKDMLNFIETSLEETPQVGSEIRFSINNSNNILRLEVIKINYVYSGQSIYFPNKYLQLNTIFPKESITCEIELYLPKIWRNLSDFYEWYAPLYGQRPSAYI